MKLLPGDAWNERVLYATMAEMREAAERLNEKAKSGVVTFLDRQEYVTPTDTFSIVIEPADVPRVAEWFKTKACAAHAAAEVALKAKLDTATTLADIEPESAAEYDTRETAAHAMAVYRTVNGRIG